MLYFHMALPLVVGVGATVLAFLAKTTISTYSKFRLLTPEMIATLNNIKVQNTSSQVDKMHPHSSQHQFLRQKYPSIGFQAKMTEKEALQILGIEEDEIMQINKLMVKEKYRKLMIANHPDKQGSEYLSQKINEAKSILDKSPLTKK